MTATVPEPGRPETLVSTKTCNRCHKELPRSLFTRKTGTADGLQRWCGHCLAVRRKGEHRVTPVTACVQCGAAIPPDRLERTDTCSRECLCLSVGLSPYFELRDLDRATEGEIRDTLDAVILAASAGCRKVAL